MNKKWFLTPVLIALAIVALLIATPAPAVYASGFEQDADQSVVLDIVIAPDGEYKVCTTLRDGYDCLSRIQVGDMLAVMNANVNISDAMQVREWLDERGVETATLDKEGNVLSVGMNGDPAVDLKLSDAAFDTVFNRLLPTFTPLVPFLRNVDFTLRLFTGEVSDVAIGKVLPVGTGLNVIDVPVTVHPEGKILSVGGLAPVQLGTNLQLPTDFMSLIESLGFTTAELGLNGNQIVLSANGEELAEATFNIPVVKGLGDDFIPDSFTPLVAFAESWLPDTALTIHAEISEEPQSEPLYAKFGRPVEITRSTEGLVMVEGMVLPFALPQELARLGSFSLVLDGEHRQVRIAGLAVNLGEGLLETLGTNILNVRAIAWNWLDRLLNNLALTVNLAAPGEPAPVAMPYVPVPETLPVVAVIPVTIGSDSFSVLGEKVPIDRFGVNLAPTILAYKQYLQQLRSVSLSPYGVEFGIAGSSLGLVLDPSVRGESVKYGVAMLAQQLNIPPSSNTEWVSTTLTNLLANAGGQIRIEVANIDGPVPGGILEGILNLMMPVQ